MDLIQFEGRTVAVIAPEDLEALEAENLRLKIAMDRYRAAMNKLENHHQGLTPLQLRIVDRALYPEKNLTEF